MNRDNERYISFAGITAENTVGISGEKKYPDQIAAEYLSLLPLPLKASGSPVKLLANSIKYSQRSNEKLVIVSTVCPSYSTDSTGTPDYNNLEVDISPNTQRHFDHLPNANKVLEKNNINYIHFFLMADTEVDLLPFLSKLDISPSEFISRCQTSVDNISKQVENVYGQQIYKDEEIPSASRFLDYFGEKVWFPKYEKYLARLLSEKEADPNGKISRALEYDYNERRVLITKLLGNRISKEDGVKHIARQKAQYMAFASLMKERFGQRLIVANHRTPNFAWMNDKITREPDDPDEVAKGNYYPQIPLIELDISTMPKS